MSIRVKILPEDVIIRNISVSSEEEVKFFVFVLTSNGSTVLSANMLIDIIMVCK